MTTPRQSSAPAIARLVELEHVIERGQQTFIEVGLALLEIRDERLYRESYATFEDYCRERWGWSRDYGIKLANAAEVVHMLGSVDHGIQTERQARELAPLRDEPKVMREIWDEAVELYGPEPTAKEIREVRLGVHFSSENEGWETPQDLFDDLDAEFRFEVDVCATADNSKCETYFSREQNGLNQPWRGSCWMNPPYGDVIGAWIAKAHEAGERGATVVCLVPARTDTNWWWDHARYGEVRFLKGRLRFVGAESGAPFPSAVVIFGRPACVKWWER